MTSSPNPAGALPESTRKRRLQGNPAEVERPEFLAWFPDHPLLQAAVRAFLKGDYHTTRHVCGELLDQDLDADVHDAARELLRRLAPDRLVIRVLWGSFVLLVLIVLWAYGQQ